MHDKSYKKSKKMFIELIKNYSEEERYLSILSLAFSKFLDFKFNQDKKLLSEVLCLLKNINRYKKDLDITDLETSLRI